MAFRGTPPNKIPESKIQEAYAFHLGHPSLSWGELAASVGMKPSTIRHIFKRRWGIVKGNLRLLRRRHRRYGVIPDQVVENIVGFLRQHPQTSRAELAKQFGISAQSVSNVFRRQYGRPFKQAVAQLVGGAPSVAVPPVQLEPPKSNGAFRLILAEHLAYLDSLEDKVATLEHKVQEQTTSKIRIMEIAAKLQDVIAHRE